MFSIFVKANLVIWGVEALYEQATISCKIWESANKMRSKIEANEYKDYILGFMFYKFLSEKEVKYLKSTGWTDEYLHEVNESIMR